MRWCSWKLGGVVKRVGGGEMKQKWRGKMKKKWVEKKNFKNKIKKWEEMRGSVVLEAGRYGRRENWGGGGVSGKRERGERKERKVIIIK